MAIFYIASGIYHFKNPDLYEKVIPPFIPKKKFLNEVIGGSQIIFSVCLLIPKISMLGAWLLIFILIIVYPANIYMFISKEAGIGIPRWILFLRLFLQYYLIQWAYLYT